MVYGYFLDGIDVPYIEVMVFLGKKAVRSVFVMDTGFSGDLKIDEQLARELGVIAIEEGHIANAQGEKIRVGRTRGYVELEGRKILVSIFILTGAQLAGIGLFSAFGYKVVVDCKHRTAHLEGVA